MNKELRHSGSKILYKELLVSSHKATVVSGGINCCRSYKSECSNLASDGQSRPDSGFQGSCWHHRRAGDNGTKRNVVQSCASILEQPGAGSLHCYCLTPGLHI